MFKLSSEFNYYFFENYVECSKEVCHWKGARKGGYPTNRESKKDKEIQGVSLEMHLFSFWRGSIFIGNLQ
jgi:hypothetical protein